MSAYVDLLQATQLDPHDPVADPNPHMARYAEIWQGMDKVVASSSLPEEAITSARTRIVRDLSLGELQRIVLHIDQHMLGDSSDWYTGTRAHELELAG